MDLPSMYDRYDEISDLRLMCEMIAEKLGLPPSASAGEVTVAARVALSRLAVADAMDAARSARLDALIAGRAT